MANRLTTLSVAIALLVGTVSYADDVNGAAKAFSQAQEAMLAGDAARAADLTSSPTTSPRRRQHCATQPERGSQPITMRWPPRSPPSSCAAIRTTRKRATSPRRSCRSWARASRSSRSAAARTALISLDGKATVSKPRTHHAFFAQPGTRTVAATFDGNRQTTKTVSADAGKTTTLTLDAPPKAAVAEPLAGRASRVGRRGPTGQHGRAGTGTPASRGRAHVDRCHRRRGRRARRRDRGRRRGDAERA